MQCSLPEYSLPSLCNFDLTLWTPIFPFSLFLSSLLSLILFLITDFLGDFTGDTLSIDILAGDFVGLLDLVTLKL